MLFPKALQKINPWECTFADKFVLLHLAAVVHWHFIVLAECTFFCTVNISVMNALG